MKFDDVRLSKLGIALDMVAVTGLMFAWMLGTWATAIALVLAIVKLQLGLALVAVAYLAVGSLTWWICRGIVRRRRFRTGLAGLAALGMAALIVYGNLTMQESTGGAPYDTAIPVVLFVTIGLVLVVATFAMPRD